MLVFKVPLDFCFILSFFETVEPQTLKPYYILLWKVPSVSKSVWHWGVWVKVAILQVASGDLLLLKLSFR